MKEKVNVTGVPETMVQTLYARAKETRKKNAKIKMGLFKLALVLKICYNNNSKILEVKNDYN